MKKTQSNYHKGTNYCIVLFILFFTNNAWTQAPFITTWKTNNPGISNSSSITIPTYPGETYNYEVDWDNDGIYEQTGITGDVTHNFGASGTYTIRIRGVFPRIYFFSNYFCDTEKIVSIDQWGDIVWSSMEKAFVETSNLEYNATDVPDLSGVTSLSCMFCWSSFNGDINNWDVSSAVDMSYMFYSADFFNQPLDNWDVSSVTNMSHMFDGDINTFAFNQPLDNWDVSSVTDMSHMFSSARVFNQPLNNWDVSSVTNMEYMFSEAYAFNQPLDNWDVSSVTNMSNMFSILSCCDNNVFNQPLGNWDVSNVTDMSYMFAYAIAFNQPLDYWDVSNVTDMSSMFLVAYSFNQPLDYWDVSSVADMSYMFAYTEFNQQLDYWDVSNVVDMEGMFSSTFFNKPLNDWDVSSVTDMSGMFSLAVHFNQPLDNWDVSSVTRMSGMFSSYSYEVTAFNQPLNNWDVSNVTDMLNMFNQASAFNQPLDNWDVSSVTRMSGMFDDAKVFNQPLDNWDVSGVTDMIYMFRNASSFNQPLNMWDISSVMRMVDMLSWSNLSVANYNSTLVGWANQTVQPNVQLGVAGLSYCEAEAERASLIADDGWTIVGDVKVACSQFDVSGTVYNCNNQPINQVNLTLTGDTVATTITPTTGTYNFESIYSGNYTLTPTKTNTATASGITGLDVLLIQRHILGNTPLSEPCQLIAADVNGNCEVTGLDILWMKQIILGNWTEFPSGAQWRFVPDAYALPTDGTVPCNFPEMIEYSPLLQNEVEQDFKAIKLGDVSSQ